MKSIGFLALALAAGLATTAPARADEPFLPIASHDLKSAEGLTYRIIVAPPAGPAPAAGYPVIYVVDGNAWAPFVSEVIRTNLEFGLRSKVEPAVVVGIGYPIEGAFDLSRRDWDLTTPSPVPSDAGSSKIGGYEAMIRFIQERVKPDIEKRFAIDRTRQTLAGHSLGGLFTLRTLMNHSDWFQTYLALSPSIWWHDALLLKEAAAFSPSPAQRAARVYIGVGELEEYLTAKYRVEMEAQARILFAADPKSLGAESVEAFVAAMSSRKQHMVDNARMMAKSLGDKGIKVKFDLFPEEDHFSVLPSEFGRAVPFALGK
ncbi:alpha/beta hydrolase [Sphingomonas colocasiae]|uniref:Alpha/beta hydrolase n=1 Tax=Sphingomonas colocasiae TaxID=1848973 RepID=A0ABS7PY49_9SPHN|nr:alpha/beta hydrolase-fold protein [Sphingomonas colocasiae]MBY8826236.1 hypothetical protein [Sphingomonas colocasiae]